MRRLIERIRIGRRLALVSVAFTLPMIVMIAIIVSTINKDLRFSQLELEGDAYQRPLEALLDAVSEHRLFGTADSAARADKAFAELAGEQARVGGDLQFTVEGLTARKREHVQLETVRREWDALKAVSGPAADAHVHLISDLRTMIMHAGDTSNLILDPDLDSFYTMDATLVALPQTQDRIAGVIASGQDFAARHEITDAERTQMAIAAAVLKESDADRIAADVQTAISEDGNFQGVSATLQQNLPPAAGAYAKAVEAVIAAIAKAAQPKSGDAEAKAVIETGRIARTASFELWNVAQRELDVLLQARVADRQHTRLVMLALSLLAWLGAQAVVALLSRSITRPLTHISSDLMAAAREVASAAGQGSTAAQSLSQGATEQAASLEETSASIEEMASMTRKNANNSREAAGLMASVDQKVRESNEALAGMITSMQDIQESSRHVAKIMKTIDEIAFQTNILALNAAVEAARAGEAGLGFAVVADEVRNLAQRSASAARDTASLIDASIARAHAGGEKVQEVAAAIGAITDSVTQVKGLVEDVKVASQQQSQGIDQVSQAVAQMEKVTQTTAATAEESAASGEELHAQAELSMQIVSRLEQMVTGARRSVGDPSRRRPADLRRRAKSKTRGKIDAVAGLHQTAA